MIYRDAQKNSDTLWPTGGGEFLKRNFTYLYCTKYNENNMYNLDAQNLASYKGSHKSFLIHYGICFEIAKNVFSFTL